MEVQVIIRIKYEKAEYNEVKTMIFVFNKDRIKTYLVSMLTVAMLIIFSNIGNIKSIQTSSVPKYLPIYNVKTDEKKIAFTMNCAC